LTPVELILTIAAESRHLKESGLKVLLQVVAKSVELGSSEVTVSTRWIAERANLSREGVSRGIRELKDLVTVTSERGVVTTFALPPHWRCTSQPFLVPFPRVENSTNWPGIQATTGQEFRPPLARNPGQQQRRNDATGQESRPPLARNLGQSEDNWPGIQASHDEESTTYAEEKANGHIDRSRGTVSKREVVVQVIDRVLQACGKDLLDEHAALRARDQLHSYMHRHGPPDGDKNPPDETIIAQILAIAPEETVYWTLQRMSKAGTACGRSYSWFVTTLLQRLHRADPKVTRERQTLLTKQRSAAKGREAPPEDNWMPDLEHLGRKMRM
jgi:hypothetical protein